MNQPIEASLSNSNAATSKNPKRRAVLFALLALIVAAAGGGGWAYWELVGSRHVSTDNAYTAAEVAVVTAEIALLVGLAHAALLSGGSYCVPDGTSSIDNYRQ
jgi:membrane fusion protein (multidrug efflux system)